MRNRGRIYGGDKNDFSFCSAPICRAETIQWRENDQLSARIPSLCKFLLFICLPSVDYLWRRNGVCGAWGGGGTQLCDCISPEIINFCPQRDLSRHRTLMQNKAVNSKCQLITVGTLPMSRCVPFGFFYLKQKTQRAEECIFLYFTKEKLHQTRQGGWRILYWLKLL